MTKVKVHIMRGPLKEIVGNGKISIQTKKNVRVIEVLNLLAEKYGKQFRDFVFNQKNEINSYLMLALNGVHINNTNGLETRIEHDSELMILSATGGG